MRRLILVAFGLFFASPCVAETPWYLIDSHHARCVTSSNPALANAGALHQYNVTHRISDDMRVQKYFDDSTWYVVVAANDVMFFFFPDYAKCEFMRQSATQAGLLPGR